MDGFFFGGGFQILFFLTFALILGMVVFTFARNIGQWSKNNRSPRLTVDAVAVAKREEVSVSHHPTGNAAMHTSSHTEYFITFQVESGDRMELPVSGSEYGMVVEGDRGRLTFQGTRFLSFDR